MATLLRVVILATAVWMGFHVISQGRHIRANPVGDPPIPKPAFLLAKVGAGISFLLVVLKAAFAPSHLTDGLNVVCLCLWTGGTVLFVTGISRLGGSLRVGLPEEQTALVTTGVYRFSRNPVYVGMYVMLAVSLIYAFSWLNLAAALTAFVLHHRIVLSEEKFLAAKFSDYEAYRAGVRRYL